ncbi:thiol-disulfide oxidoreductase ResA [Bacillus sp. Marseille-P3661]|uniref:thiol-disulfide oxidoreductase ResA n=1 Tax=Bacillus sp. Marseille-P3661 TaxID=1936234 RepID=UPI000C82F6D5|nr:thiol-disulfide oxidoreductase ResA [Bacillus sp. Marseille-P3661]
MKKNRSVIRSVILLILLGALGFTLYTNFFTEKELVGIGDQAPNFILNDLSGEPIEFDSLRGKGVFLNFWATWCPPCEEEMPYMENMYHQYKDKGVEILAVNVGESNLAVENFVNRKGLSFPVLMDSNTEVLETYGINPLPTTLLVDKNGEIIDIITGSLTEEAIMNHMERIKP